MMTHTRMATLSWIVALALTLSACGGGGAAPTFGGGIGGTGKPALVLGTVTALGSVKIGGVIYDTSSADIVIDGAGATQADLQLGMVALLEVEDATRVATRVEVEHLVKGPISAVGSDSLTVLGQIVEVDEQTVYAPGISPSGLAGLQVGDLVEVHGLVKGPALLLGRRIEKEDGLSELRVTGFATNVNTAARTFDLGSQGVDYVAADTSDLAGGHPTAGQLVQVRAASALTTAGRLDALEVRAVDLDDGEDREKVEIEGFVTALGSPTQFVLGSVPVSTSATTSYEGGVLSDIVVGVQLEVEGALVSGVLLAREIEFKESARLEADIASVVGNTITLVGLPGVSVLVNASTEYEGDASSLGNLQAGDHIEVRGRVTGARSLTATQVKETSADSRMSLQGPVDAGASDPLFSIFGVSVDTTAFSDVDFQIGDGQVLGRAAFFAAIASGALVEAQGDLVGGVPVWDEVELEGEDD